MVVPSFHYDPSDLHDTVSNTERLTANLSGYYFVFARVNFVVAPAYTELKILKNGAGIGEAAYTAESASAANNCSFEISAIVQLDATDYVSLTFYHNYGSAQNVTGATSRFGMHRIG